MSKTVDSLLADFDAAVSRAQSLNREDLPAWAHRRAGLAAVVRALRDEFENEMGKCLHCSASGVHDHIDEVFDKILGASGDEAAGGPRPEAMGSAPPAAAPAPVCEWTPLRADSDLHTTACGKAIWRCNEHAGICLYCKAPIKFTEESK